MARLVAVAGCALLWSALLAPAAVTAGPTVDLDRPGALAALEQANPAHYAKVRADRPDQPSREAPPVVRAGRHALRGRDRPDPPARRHRPLEIVPAC